MPKLTHHRCPECGNRDYLYGRADCRWNFEWQVWVIGDMEDEIECTECDWIGCEADTLFNEEESDNA